MVCQKTHKAFIEVLNNSEKKKNVYLNVKKPMIYFLSLAALMSILEVDSTQPRPTDSSAPSLVTFSGCVFANIQDTNRYNKFINADNEI